MSDLIDRQEAIDAVKHAWAKGLEPTQYIEDMPSAQPEIIRCKDCKHYYYAGNRIYYADNRIYYADNRIPQEQGYSCDLDGDRWKPEDFCSRAERRADG